MSPTSEWQEIALQDLATEITVGFVGPMASEYVPKGIPFLRSLNVEPYRINHAELMYVSESFHQKLKKSALAPGDVVIVRTGKPGTAAVIPDTLPIANCSDLVIVRPGPQLDARFLAYYINSAAQHHVFAHTVGAVQQHFNVGSAKTLKLLRPPLDEQRAIVRILGALDDKIELNRQMNRTLETLAQALFRSWFVDFEPVTAKREGRKPVGIDDATAALFPEHFQETAIGQIPAGWRPGKIGDIISLSKQSITPGDHPDENFSHYSIPAFDTGKLPILEQGSAIKSNKHIVLDGCVLISKLNPENPRVWLPCKRTESKAICSTEFLVALPQNPFSTTYVYSFLSSDEFLGEFATFVTGTSNSHQRVKPDDFLRMDAVLPEPAVVLAFQKQISTLLDRAQNTHYESAILAALRDALLPELLSGGLRVGRAEKIVGQA